jgi:hypothetical protein
MELWSLGVPNHIFDTGGTRDTCNNRQTYRSKYISFPIVEYLSEKKVTPQLSESGVRRISNSPSQGVDDFLTPWVGESATHTLNKSGSQQLSYLPMREVFFPFNKRRIFWWFFMYWIKTASFATSQIPLRWWMLGSNPGPLKQLHWQSDALIIRLDLII